MLLGEYGVRGLGVERVERVLNFKERQKIYNYPTRYECSCKYQLLKCKYALGAGIEYREEHTALYRNPYSHNHQNLPEIYQHKPM